MFDGHNGDDAAKFVCDNLHTVLEEELTAHSSQIGKDCPPATDFAIKDSMINAFERVDHLYLEDHAESQAGEPCTRSCLSL